MAFALLLWGGGRDVGGRKTHEIPGCPEGLCHSWDILTQPPRSRTQPGAGQACLAEQPRCCLRWLQLLRKGGPFQFA